MAISADGRVVAASIDDSIGLWETDSGKPILQDFPAHRNAAPFVACAPDDKLIVSAGYDGHRVIEEREKSLRKVREALNRLVRTRRPRPGAQTKEVGIEQKVTEETKE